MKYDYDLFCRALGVRVKQLREKRGLSHRGMVERFGLHLGQLEKLESGESVSMQTLVKLCDAFDMTMEELMRDLDA